MYSGNPCDFALCSYPHSVCKVVGNKATCQCRQQCTQHVDPVCASDGQTYDNMCMLEVIACNLEEGGMPAGKLTYIGNGNCTGMVSSRRYVLNPLLSSAFVPRDASVDIVYRSKGLF